MLISYRLISSDREVKRRGRQTRRERKDTEEARQARLEYLPYRNNIMEFGAFSPPASQKLLFSPHPFQIRKKKNNRE